MLLNELVHDDLDEGWREKTAAAMTAATLGWGALSQMDRPPSPEGGRVQSTLRQAPAPNPDRALYQLVPQENHHLIRLAQKSGISGTELRHFLAQIMAETGNFSHMEEQPPQGARNPQRYFAKKYERSKILGNVKPGDGYRYRGRGYIQLTGRDNYTRAGRALGLDLANNPDLASEPNNAARIAIWFWKNRVVPRVGDFKRAAVSDVTRGINPGQRGAEKRQAYFQRVSQPR